MLSHTEENYLKALFKIGANNEAGEVGTNELATALDVKPASVNAMLKKLREKKLVSYEKYGKINLTSQGRLMAIDVVRKHRLWETFLYEKLDFNWDEVHELAEELEHIQSKTLIARLDKLLNYPHFDPHGDPIPDENGVFKKRSKKTLAEVAVGNACKMVAVKDNSAAFLQYVAQLGLGIKSPVKVLAREEFDGQTVIEVHGTTRTVSLKFTENIYVAE